MYKRQSETSASLIIAELLFLEAQDPQKNVQFYINSPGGSVTAGFAIYDTMRHIRCDVSTICIGLAASFGAFLLAGGTRGKRLALPNSQIMIHQPAMSGRGIQGPASDILIMSDYMQKSRQRLNRILAENTGHTPLAVSYTHLLCGQQAGRGQRHRPGGGPDEGLYLLRDRAAHGRGHEPPGRLRDGGKPSGGGRCV